MTRSELVSFIYAKQSFLCVGLDSDLEKIPPHLRSEKNPVLSFNKAVIDATRDFCVAYKPNIAFYEAMGTKGWEILEATLDYIPRSHFTIADAKRGDIGNTSRLYAKTFFETFNFDAVTVSPYMGVDSVEPFLEFSEKWVIILALTSNRGSKDFQLEEDKFGRKLFEKILQRSSTWGNTENIMYVVGATQASALTGIRKIIPEHFLLVPGVGAQGGKLVEVWQYGHNHDAGLLVNSSRGIIYAGGTDVDFSDKVSLAAAQIQKLMARLLASNSS